MHHSYLVRVYRHEKDNPRMLVGTVESIDDRRKKTFTTIDELWEIVNGETECNANTNKAGERPGGK